MKNISEQIFTDEAVANETVTSQEIDIRHCLGFMLDCVYTGTSLQGTAKLQFKTHKDGTWRDAPNSGDTAHHTVVAAGSNVQWYVKDTYGAYVRLSFATTDADEATVNAHIFAKGV